MRMSESRVRAFIPVSTTKGLNKKPNHKQACLASAADRRFRCASALGIFFAFCPGPILNDSRVTSLVSAEDVGTERTSTSREPSATTSGSPGGAAA